MRWSPSPASHATAIALALLACQVVMLADLGFGTFRKRKLTLQVRQPALVRLANTSIGFTGSATNPQYQSVLPTLQATLETELISNERTLVKKQPAEADWVLDARVTSYSVPRAERRTQVINNKSVQYVKYRGTLAVAYQVLDQKGNVHAADNVSTSYEQEFDASNPGAKPLFGVLTIPGTGSGTGPAPRSEEDVTQLLVRDLVQKVAANLGNTVQPVEAQVAAGDDAMDRSADFMDRRLWSRAIEELEKVTPYKKPSDESYRLYNLGLAHEAMSYESKVYKEQRANLTKAQTLYDQAAEMNRGEKYFVEVLSRIRDSIARYRELDAMEGKPAPKTATVAAPPPAPAAPPPATPAAPAAAALTAKDVLLLLDAGIRHDQIIEKIRASEPGYDLLDTATIVSLKNVPLPIMNEMRKRVGMEPLAAQPAAGRGTATSTAKPATAKPAAPAGTTKPATK